MQIKRNTVVNDVLSRQLLAFSTSTPDDQLKPNISVEVVEERPRHIIIMWNYTVPEIAKEKRVLLTGRVKTTGEEHTIFVDDELNGSETLNVDNEEREYNIVFATAFTDAPDVGSSATKSRSFCSRTHDRDHLS
ncbi:hypothetical protein V3C99_005409 [Haemonchus contortus]